MFQSEEILQEFAEAAQLGERFVMFGAQALSLAEFNGEFRSKDLAQKFLDADEETREEMRKLPLPKSTFKDRLSVVSLVSERPISRKHGERLLTKEEIMMIKKEVGRSMSQREAARLYRVSHTTIQRALKS